MEDKRALGRDKPVGEGVLLKATGRAINKCLSLGLHLLKDDTLNVRIYTGSVDVVDDVVKIPGGVKSQDAENRDAVSPTATSATITAPPPTTALTPLHTITTGKRKATDLQPDSSPPSFSLVHTHRAQLRKRPRTGKQTNGNTTITSNPCIPHHSIDTLITPVSSFIGDTSDAIAGEIYATDVGTGSKNIDSDNNHDGGHDNDDGDCDDSDNYGDYTRARKTSMLEIKITLVRP